MSKRGSFGKICTGVIFLLTFYGLGQAQPPYMKPDERCVEILGGMLVDNFEYWTTPNAMGWRVMYPCLPPWLLCDCSPCWGEAETALDFEEGSRVMDVSRTIPDFLDSLFRTTSLDDEKRIWLLDRYMSSSSFFSIEKNVSYLDTHGNVQAAIPSVYNLLSFKVKALRIDYFDDDSDPLRFIDAFRFIVKVKTTNNGYAEIHMIPQGEPAGESPSDFLETVKEKAGPISSDDKRPSIIEVYMGTQFIDCRWHLVELDLNEAVKKYSTLDEELDQILSIIIKGDRYRMDDIVFWYSPEALKENNVPYLFKIGPIYSQLWKPKGSFIFAEDRDLNLFLEKDDEGTIYFPHIKDDMGRDDRDSEFDLSTARLYQEDGSPQGPDEVNLRFYVTVGNELGSPTSGIMQSIPTDPNNIPVLQIPRLEAPRDLWVTNRDLHDGTLRARTVHNKMYVLAQALKNSGYDVWPNIGMFMPGQGQVFEDMIFTYRVCDTLGIMVNDTFRVYERPSGDSETFPVSVVTHPITNQPPLIEDLKDQHFEVGKRGTYHITACDPDQEDMLGLTFSACLENRWVLFGEEPEWIDPVTGTFSFIPWAEGEMRFTVEVSDPGGLDAVREFTVFCVNHEPVPAFHRPPEIVRMIESPQRVRAGQVFFLPGPCFQDPHGDPLYYSCNIGSFTGEGVYALLTYFPGSYQITLTAYNTRGKSVSQEFTLEVLPWWSY